MQATLDALATQARQLVPAPWMARFRVVERRTNVVALPLNLSVRSLGESLKDAHRHRGQRLYPVLDGDDVLAGVVAASELERALESAHSSDAEQPLRDRHVVPGRRAGQP